ncbi:polysaccharide deacetylase family protein [Candidatus Puniceispirillum sp.]|uniref:polysaccharide deacetylase family protein n=1 Tax=Candidatus Puniceispirillum sp. TaxID=2026719 RepID=UPI003F6992C9
MGTLLRGRFLKLYMMVMLIIAYGTSVGAAMAADHASILMYHRFGETKYPTTNIRLAQFDAHLDRLQSGDFTVWPLPRIVEYLQSGQPLPDRTVAITIDDAYLSVYQEAWPRLKALNMPFTLFVATQPIDANRYGYMTWDHIRELQSAGVTIGSQTRTHPHMHQISIEQSKSEIAESNARFIAELGLRPSLFAYPYGEYDRQVIQAVMDAGFTAAFGQNSGIAHGYNGFYELPRFAMNEQYGTLSRLDLAINGLPLKVDQITPEDVILDQNPPIYGFTLAPDMDKPKQLRCFNSIYGKLDVTMMGRRAEIRMPGPLNGKRARINCTMPGEDGRWRWFGRQFLNR